MRAVIIVIALSVHAGLLAGCAGNESIFGGIYEGLKTRETLVHPVLEQKATDKNVSYQAYQAERKKLLEKGE